MPPESMRKTLPGKLPDPDILSSSQSQEPAMAGDAIKLSDLPICSPENIKAKISPRWVWKITVTYQNVTYGPFYAVAVDQPEALSVLFRHYAEIQRVSPYARFRITGDWEVTVRDKDKVLGPYIVENARHQGEAFEIAKRENSELESLSEAALISARRGGVPKKVPSSLAG